MTLRARTIPNGILLEWKILDSQKPSKQELHERKKTITSEFFESPYYAQGPRPKSNYDQNKGRGFRFPRLPALNFNNLKNSLAGNPIGQHFRNWWIGLDNKQRTFIKLVVAVLTLNFLWAQFHGGHIFGKLFGHNALHSHGHPPVFRSHQLPMTSRPAYYPDQDQHRQPTYASSSLPMSYQSVSNRGSRPTKVSSQTKVPSPTKRKSSPRPSNPTPAGFLRHYRHPA